MTKTPKNRTDYAEALVAPPAILPDFFTSQEEAGDQPSLVDEDWMLQKSLEQKRLEASMTDDNADEVTKLIYVNTLKVIN